MRNFNQALIPKPPNLPEFPQTNMPLDIEIGCGVGLHPIQYALEHPERYLIAIEHTSEKFSKFERRFENNGRPVNLLPIHANAISWITHMVPPQSVDQYFLLYPNPHPKPKQKNQRWHAMPFMSKIIETLKPGGSLILATNEKFYADEAKEELSEVWKLKLINDSTWSIEKKARTHFEKKYLERGEICYNLIFQRSLD